MCANESPSQVQRLMLPNHYNVVEFCCISDSVHICITIVFELYKINKSF